MVRTEAKFFHNRYHSVDDEGRHLRNWPAPSLRNHLRAITLGNFLSCIGVFIHRDIYTKYRFDTNPVLTGSEDYEFWLRIAAEHGVRRINRVNSAIVNHSGRTMVAQDLGMARRRVQYLLHKVFSDDHLAEVYGPYRDRMHAGQMVYLASIANDNENWRAALGSLREALIGYPPITGYARFFRSAQLALLNVFR
ncbi:hypothetical protein HQ520_06090 [bacterium]|nr:hypothetical protein [bacterium]